MCIQFGSLDRNWLDYFINYMLQMLHFYSQIYTRIKGIKQMVYIKDGVNNF